MGCKQSDLRRSPADNDGRPAVPEGCWYAQPLAEHSSMVVTPFHEQMKGAVVFSKRPIPASAAEVSSLPGGVPNTLAQGAAVDLGTDQLFAMAYLHETALVTEHTWRLRVGVVEGLGSVQRPFYDTLIGIRLLLDGHVVPDVAPHRDSIHGCTATLRAPDALAQWRLVPLVLLPDPTHKTHSVIRLWDGLIFSFADYCQRLEPGAHSLIVEVVYGSGKDKFCSGVLASGEKVVVVSATAKLRLIELAQGLYPKVKKGGLNIKYIPATGTTEGRCLRCDSAHKFLCCTCGAPVCGSNLCSFEPRGGYPAGCEAHEPVAPT